MGQLEVPEAASTVPWAHVPYRAPYRYLKGLQSLTVVASQSCRPAHASAHASALGPCMTLPLPCLFSRLCFSSPIRLNMHGIQPPSVSTHSPPKSMRCSSVLGSAARRETSDSYRVRESGGPHHPHSSVVSVEVTVELAGEVLITLIHQLCLLKLLLSWPGRSSSPSFISCVC